MGINTLRPAEVRRLTGIGIHINDQVAAPVEVAAGKVAFAEFVDVEVVATGQSTQIRNGRRPIVK